MPKRKCSSCDRKIDVKFSFCPHCGVRTNGKSNREDFGMLGNNDEINVNDNLRMPFGMEKMMGSLIKQLERQIGNMDIDGMEGMPKGIKIKVSRGMPRVNQVIREKSKFVKQSKVSEKEARRRVGLKRVEAESKVKRLMDTIIYEIDTPGVKNKEDVELIELATGLEIKAYSKDNCYIKFIPLKLEVIGYRVKQEKVFVELKS